MVSLKSNCNVNNVGTQNACSVIISESITDQNLFLDGQMMSKKESNSRTKKNTRFNVVRQCAHATEKQDKHPLSNNGYRLREISTILSIL